MSDQPNPVLDLLRLQSDMLASSNSKLDELIKRFGALEVAVKGLRREVGVLTQIARSGG